MKIQGLTKRYQGRTVVNGVSFSIPKGKVTSLIGPNGAGKSTVMSMISRLIAQDEGLVELDGTHIGHWKSRELARRLAILTQSNNIQMKLTVRELVAFGRFPYSGSRLTAEDTEIIDRAIAYMELEEFQDRFLDELSGGQRQRASDRHGHRPGHRVYPVGRAHQQSGHLPRHQFDEDGAPPVR